MPSQRLSETMIGVLRRRGLLTGETIADQGLAALKAAQDEGRSR